VDPDPLRVEDASERGERCSGRLSHAHSEAPAYPRSTVRSRLSQWSSMCSRIFVATVAAVVTQSPESVPLAVIQIAVNWAVPAAVPLPYRCASRVAPFGTVSSIE